MPARNRQRPGGASMLTPQPEALTRDPGGSPASRSGPAAASADAEAVAMKYLSARVPKELRDELQHQAIREDRPVARLVQDAVRAYLDQHAPPE